MDELTFSFEDDQVYALKEGKVIASADSIEELEQKMAQGPDLSMQQGVPDPASQQGQTGCAMCGQVTNEPGGVCAKCSQQIQTQGQPSNASTPPAAPMPGAPTVASMIETPNGLRGKVLGKHSNVFEDEVTVRFENGHIASLPVREVKTAKPTQAPNVLENIRERVAAKTDPDTDALRARLAELGELQEKCSKIIRSGVSFKEELELDGLALTAAGEEQEIKDHLEYLDNEAEPYAPPTPQVVEQADVGHKSDGGWLDQTLDEMIDEAMNTDYEKLMAEGPEMFVTELDEGALESPDSTRAMASSFIRSKTAGADNKLRNKYEQVFLERVENARKKEAAHRDNEKKTAQTKEASVEGPDEALFG